MNFSDFFAQKIKQKQDANSLKRLVEVDRSSFPTLKLKNKKLTSFACNDYLGLSVNKSVKNAVIKASKKCVGSGGSKFIAGYTTQAKILEAMLAKYKDFEDCAVFSSGYLANLGCFASIFDKNDIIFADKHVHASIIDAILLSKAKLVRYDHLNHLHLQRLIATHADNASYGKIAIATEFVFSMSGEVDNLQSLANIATKAGAMLLVDDAHGFGVVTMPHLADLINNNNNMLIVTGTLSKAAGLCGGYVCGSKLAIEFIKNYARSGIYNTFLPPNIVAGLCKSLEIITKNTKMDIAINNPSKPLQNAIFFVDTFNNLAKKHNINFCLQQARSAIVVLNLSSVVEFNAVSAEKMSLYLYNQGFFARHILPPTVANCIIRLTFSSLHTKKQITNLANACVEWILQNKGF